MEKRVGENCLIYNTQNINYYEVDKFTLTFALISFSFHGQVRKVRCASLVKLFLALLAPQENQESQEKWDCQVKERHQI